MNVPEKPIRCMDEFKVKKTINAYRSSNKGKHFSKFLFSVLSQTACDERVNKPLGGLARQILPNVPDIVQIIKRASV